MSYPFRINSLEQYHEDYKKAAEDPEAFWANVADNFHWRKKWDKVLNWNFSEPSINWYTGGTMNITENCLDRHIEVLGDKPAIIWEPNNPEEQYREITYKELLFNVNQFSNVLKNNGIKTDVNNPDSKNQRLLLKNVSF